MNLPQQLLLHKTYIQAASVNIVSCGGVAHGAPLLPKGLREDNGCVCVRGVCERVIFFNGVATYTLLVFLYITYPTLSQETQTQWVTHRKTQE